MKDMRTFIFILTVTIVGFANTFYVLALNGVKNESCEAQDFVGLSDADKEKL